MTSFVDCTIVKDALSCIDDLGLNISKIGILTRVWDGKKLGLGNVVDTVSYFSPTPRIKQVRQSHNNSESGLSKKGDIVITLVPKSQYPTKDLIEAVSVSEKVEKYYYVSGEIYELVEITEKLLYWNILVKKAKYRKLFV